MVHVKVRKEVGITMVHNKVFLVRNKMRMIIQDGRVQNINSGI